MPTPLFKKGRTKTGGRKKGSPYRKLDAAEQRRKEAREREIQQAKAEFQAAMAGEMSFTPLQVMYAVMLLRIGRGDDQGALEAAKEAAPFVHAKLTAAEVMVKHALQSRSDAEITAEIEQLRLKIAASKTIDAMPVVADETNDMTVRDMVEVPAHE
jgi:hypothetical protein